MSSAPRRARSTRMPGSLLVYASAIVVAVAVAGAWLALTRRPNAAGIVDLLAIDGEYAAMVREVDNDPGRAFLSLMQAGRGEVWGAMIPRYEPGEDTLLGATAGNVTVRAITGDVPYIHVFAARRGAKLGRYALADAPGQVQGAEASTIADSGQSFEFLRVTGGAAERVDKAVAAFDLERGVPLWRRTFGTGSIEPLWLGDRHLVLHDALNRRVHVLDRHTGEPARVHAAGRADGDAREQDDDADGADMLWACAVAGRVYGVAPTGVVTALSPASGELRATELATSRLAPARHLLCGTHGDRDIVTTVADDGATALVAVDARTGALAWRVELHGAQPDGESDLHAHQAGDLRVEPWPRFLPVLVGDREVRLMWIDLEIGSLAHAGTPARELSSARIVRAGGRFYLQALAAAAAGAGDDPFLAILDGARPAITAAIAMPDMWPVLPQHVAGGRVWVTQGAKDSRRGPPGTWLVLDGETLAVVAPGNAGARAAGAIRDVRDGLATALGLP